MNTKPVAVLDLDDTLINTREAMYQCVRAEYGRDFVSHWSSWEKFKFEENTAIDVHELIELTTEKRTFDAIEPHPHAAFYTEDLIRRGFHVIILTAREGFVPDPYDTTARYLCRHGIDYDELLISAHGDNKMNSLTKYDRIDFTIDDQVKNCEHFEESGKIDHIFLHALPHNKLCNRYRRLHSLYQAYKHLGLE